MSAPGDPSDTSAVRLTTGLPETVLPAEPEAVRRALADALAQPGERRRHAVSDVVRADPRSLDAWAALGSLARDDVEAYACFRVGYHRGLDALRGSGWKGSGLVRWSHVENQGLPAVPRRAAVGGRRHRRARRGGALRPVPAAARPGVEPGPHRLPRLMVRPACRPDGRRPVRLVPVAGRWSLGAVALGGCAGQEQSGDPAQQVATWVDDGGGGSSVGNLEVDAKNIDLALAQHNKPAAIREVCALLSNDAQSGIGNLPTPDQELTTDLDNAYMEGDRRRGRLLQGSGRRRRPPGQVGGRADPDWSRCSGSPSSGCGR